ncbi:type II toxin-antitoxin system RelE/ParE family toxin [Pedobacter agri]|uniref:type II toxin-antitoxin system RelE/ParE family toxin n=1 Tax=Pedobacter agri TaxID=454586 RepID=UPI0029318A58|nr:type II toxin-antitoxin system RelE/ParE family toxin [Pedobacter agri]
MSFAEGRTFNIGSKNKNRSRDRNPIGKSCYKIRIAISSKGKGKSGGARIITHFIITDSTVYLLSIYDKSEKDNITNKELIELLSEVKE